MAIVAQHAVRMRYTVICLQNSFPYYLINGTIFEIRVIEHITFVLIYSTTFV